MKKLRIILCVFIILSIIYFNWDVITNEHRIYELLLCLLAIVFTVYICVSYLLNWRETRPVLVSVIEGSSFALFGILMAFAAWNIFTTKDDIAMSLFAATLALVSIISSISSFFNWQKNRPKLYTIISIIISVLILISLLALFIFKIMSIRPVE